MITIQSQYRLRSEDVWNQPGAAAAVSGILLVLGPAVLHAEQQHAKGLQQQQQQQQQPAVLLNFALAL
jgi:hypothetical protein